MHYQAIPTVLFMTILQFQFCRVSSHGRLLNPPARNTAWRFGFPCPVNYNDNELFCGGFNVQYNQNNGKCGLCGDNWTDKMKEHEWPGKYAVLSVITRRYYSGQLINVEFELTSNHYGHIMFRICSIIYYKKECLSQDLMDRNILPIVHDDGTESDRYVIETKEKAFTLKLTLRLPAGFNCTICCLQWTYTAGNNVGRCPDGTERPGCGPQETFVNCANVGVYQAPVKFEKRRHHHLDPGLTSTSRANPYRKYYRDMSRAGAPMTALAVKFQRCVAVGSGNGTSTPGMDKACQDRCMKYPPDCPGDICKCVKDCSAKEPFKSQQDMADQWCLDQCYVYPPKDCDEAKCSVTYAYAPNWKVG